MQISCNLFKSTNVQNRKMAPSFSVPRKFRSFNRQTDEQIAKNDSI